MSLEDDAVRNPPQGPMVRQRVIPQATTGWSPASKSGDTPAVMATSEEADDYSRSVAGVAIDAARTGRGSGSNTVQTAVLGDVIANSNTIRIPMATWATISVDHVLAAAVKAAPREAKWCGIDIRPGMMVMYGPGALHTGSNPAGLQFAFTLIRTEQLEEWSDQLGLTIHLPKRGDVGVLPRTAQSKALFATVASLERRVLSGMAARRLEVDVLHACAAVLSDRRQGAPSEARRAVRSRKVIRASIGYAESVGRIPSIGELCLTAHVSQRRLYTAFNDAFGVPPGRFFREWGLDLARRRLLVADPARGDTVTSVAIRTGFEHLGRFSGVYREAFGENPSTTLSTHRESERGATTGALEITTQPHPRT